MAWPWARNRVWQMRRRSADSSGKLGWSQREDMAERVGFEPTVGEPTAVFKTAALDRSAISPAQCGVRLTLHEQA